MEQKPLHITGKNMIIKEDLIAQVDCSLEMNRLYCDDCGAQLDWESHNAGDINFQTWVAFCECKDGERLWTARPNSLMFTSV